MPAVKSTRLSAYVIGLEVVGTRILLQVKEAPAPGPEVLPWGSRIRGTRNGKRFTIAVASWLGIRRNTLNIPRSTRDCTQGVVTVRYSYYGGEWDEAKLKSFAEGLSSVLSDNGAVVWPLVDTPSGL